jgi:lysophospholipase L1-like esterase
VKKSPLLSKLLGITLFLIGSLLIIILGGEILLRLYGVRLNTPPLYQASENPEIVYELKKNANVKAYRSRIRTNSLGFRGAELDTEKPLIVTLGDSITFGYGVEDDETLAYRIEEELTDYAVLNAGISGFNVTQERAFYEEKIDALNPAALLLIFYFNDANPNATQIDAKGNLRPADWNGEVCAPVENILRMIPGNCWLDQNSAFFRTAKNILNLQRGKQKKEREIASPIAEEQRDDLSQDELTFYEQELRALTTALGETPRFFVIWPDATLHTKSRPLLNRMAESHGFTVIDLYDEFGNDMETLTWDYMHPSVFSLKRAASVISSAMVSSGLLPSS